MIIKFCPHHCSKIIILIHNRKGAYGAGHTGLLVKDQTDKTWHHWNWAAATYTIGSKPADEESLKNVGELGNNFTLSSINKMVKQRGIYSGQYTDVIGFFGDFTKSIKKMVQIRDKKQYHLTSNNCVQTSMDALRKGTFKKYDSDYKYALGIAKGKLTPNEAFTGIDHFNNTIEGWKDMGDINLFQNLSDPMRIPISIYCNQKIL